MKREFLLSTLVLSTITSTTFSQLTPPPANTMSRVKKSLVDAILPDPTKLSDKDLDCRECVSYCCYLGGSTSGFLAVMLPCAITSFCSPACWIPGTLATAGAIAIPSCLYHDYYHNEIKKRKRSDKQKPMQNVNDQINNLNTQIKILEAEKEILLDANKQHSTTINGYNYATYAHSSLNTKEVTH